MIVKRCWSALNRVTEPVVGSSALTGDMTHEQTNQMIAVALGRVFDVFMTGVKLLEAIRL